MNSSTGQRRPRGQRGTTEAVIGLAPHSGWAAVVALGRSIAGLEVLVRSRIEMVDPLDPESKHPYHAVESLAVEEAARPLARHRAIAEDRASGAITSLAVDLAVRGWHLASVGLLDAANRRGLSLASILASHALIHAAEGDHFREALIAAAERNDLAASRVKARDLEAQAETRLGRPVTELRETVKGLGRQVGPPWGADQKAAALLAWLLLGPDA